ncbi:unnamed protein product [Coffea canephora]|uniref:Uncharacterized protein n=1 Tax=Coffea canephora TaxID=49390 RepID=A0A068URQ8_COFCA|nr:unnamed protein product [Coffea canephora]
MHLSIEGKVHKVPFQYERLPILCFYYGRIGHGKRDCELKLDAATYETGDLQYGGWLRAKPEKSFSGQQRSRPAATVSDNENRVPQGTDKGKRSTASASPDCLEFSKSDHAQSATLDSDLERYQVLIKGKSSASTSNNSDLLQPKSKSTAAPWTTNNSSAFSTQSTDDSFRLPRRKSTDSPKSSLMSSTAQSSHKRLLGSKLKRPDNCSLSDDVDMEDVSLSKKSKTAGSTTSHDISMAEANLDISLNRFASNFIDANVHMPNYTWRFTGFYGHPNASKRKYSWDSLRQLSTQSRLPWLCIGDYNEVLSQNEFQGFGPQNNWQIMNFCQALMDSNLHDVGYEGFTYTWSHSWAYPNTIRARLDHACATQDFVDLFPDSKLKHVHYIL